MALRLLLCLVLTMYLSWATVLGTSHSALDGDEPDYTPGPENLPEEHHKQQRQRDDRDDKSTG